MRTVPLEILIGEHGRAYLYGVTADVHNFYLERGTSPSLSLTEWLIEFDDLPGEVYSVSYLMLDHPRWRQFDDTYPWHVGMAYEIQVQEGNGEQMSAAIPASVSGLEDSHMTPCGTLLISADHHMRLIVDALLDGTLHPLDGYEQGEPEVWWDDLATEAEHRALGGPYVPQPPTPSPLFPEVPVVLPPVPTRPDPVPASFQE